MHTAENEACAVGLHPGRHKTAYGKQSVLPVAAESLELS